MATVYCSNSPWEYWGPESTANASYIYSFFKQQGWSDVAIFGLLGNTTHESYNNPGFWERGGYGGFGIVQWTPSSNYRDWALRKGYPCGTDYSEPEKYLLGQLWRIMYEFNNGGEWYGVPGFQMSFKTYSQRTDMSPEYAAEAFCRCYERPNLAVCNMTARKNNAKHWSETLDDTNRAYAGNQSVRAAQSAVAWIKSIANDQSHGYDQGNRWGPDYDCSSLVISAYQQAGIDVKGRGATSTRNMAPAFLAEGFRDVTNKVNLTTGEGLVAGDVLLNIEHHAAMYIGDGLICQASINEFGGILGGASGDQTGNEINIKPYYRYRHGWNMVLRGADLVGFGGYGAAGSVSIVRATKSGTFDWQDDVNRN